MSNPFEIGTPEQAFKSYMFRPFAGFDGAMTEIYGLENVPDQGRSYILRCIAQTRPGDRARIDPKYRAATIELLEHYARTGTAVIRFEDIIFEPNFGAAFTDNRPIDVFMFDGRAHGLVPNERRFWATVENEDKCRLALRWDGKSGYVPESVVVLDDPLAYGLTNYERPSPARVWHILGCRRGRLKAGICASGNDNCVFRSYGELESLMWSDEWRRRNYVAQLDVGDIDVSNVYYGDETGLHFVCGTRQENSGEFCEKHEGNYEDQSHVLLTRPLTDHMALEAWHNGLRGFFGYDLRVNAEYSRCWVVECNARITAPVYGWLLKMRHRMPWFCVMNLKGVAANSITGAISQEYEFGRRSDGGVFCHNPGPLRSEHACSVTVLADSYEQGLCILDGVRTHACGRAAEVAA